MSNKNDKLRQQLANCKSELKSLKARQELPYQSAEAKANREYVKEQQVANIVAQRRFWERPGVTSNLGTAFLGVAAFVQFYSHNYAIGIQFLALLAYARAITVEMKDHGKRPKLANCVGWGIVITGSLICSTLWLEEYSISASQRPLPIGKQVERFPKLAMSRQWKPPELPSSAYAWGNIPRVRVRFGGITFDNLIGPEDNSGPPPILFPGTGPVFTPYVKDNRIYLKALAPIGKAAQTIQMNNEWIDNLPTGWDVNFNDNSYEIVDDNGLPVLQIRYDAPNDIEVYGIFVAPSGAVTVAFGDDTTSVPPGRGIPPIPVRKAWFKYPAKTFLGKLASP